MALLQISNFVGEAPSLSGRGLGGTFARINHNLYLAAGDFRPLQADKVHSACPAGTLSLHRFHRNAAGQVQADPSAALSMYPDRRSFAKGQINDEATERTYVTFDAGDNPPRVINVKGEDRVLGVARSAAPALAVNVVDTLQVDEAQTWLYGDFVGLIQKAIVSASPSRADKNAAGLRYDAAGKSFAGAPDNYGLKTATQAGVDGLATGMIYAVVTDARAASTAMAMTRLGATKTSTGWLVPVAAMPAAYPLTRTTLQNTVQLIEFPAGFGEQSGQAVLTSAQVGVVVDAAVAAVGPGVSCDKWRSELATLLGEFSNLALVKTWAVAGAPPVKPTQPSTPRWIPDEGDSTGLHENPEWAVYDQAMDAYYTAFDAYNNKQYASTGEANSLNARMLEIQQRCAALVVSIEGQLASQWLKAVDDAAQVGTWVDKLGGLKTLTPSASVRVVDTRYYVVAMVTDWGEESQPSPLTPMVEVAAVDTVTVTRPGLLTGETFAARNIVKWRLYRSNTGQSGAAWQLVKELDIATASFLDNVPSSELDSLQPQFTWLAPPYRQDSQFTGEVKPVSGAAPYLRGMTGIDNGIMAGFIDNMVAFCEPYVPYAWPVAYQVKTEFPVVAIAGYESTVVAVTTGCPYVITGTHSASMTALKLDSFYSCASARTVVAVPGAVLYAGQAGLCSVRGGAVELVTQTYFTKEQWQAMNPAGMFAVEHVGVYYLFYSGTAGSGCLAISVEGGQFKLGRCDLVGSAAWSDKFTDVLYVVNGTKVMQCFTEAARRVGRWKSGISTLPQQTGLAWLKVYGDQTLASPVTIRWFADGELRHEVQVSSLEPERLPPGKWLEHEIEVEGAARIDRVALASSTMELRQE